VSVTQQMEIDLCSTFANKISYEDNFLKITILRIINRNLHMTGVGLWTTPPALFARKG
jgi:hypothetical protein